jgi:hypothetical protein
VEKTVKVLFSEEAEQCYQQLLQDSSKLRCSLIRAIDQKIEFLKINPYYGNPISKKLIPIEYKKKYDVKNLYRIELPQFWRMLYTLINDEIEIVALVIDITDRRNYDKKFGYKKQ